MTQGNDLALRDVLLERARQDAKWGEQNHDPFCYLTVLVEEVGEFAKAALDARFGGPEAEHLRDEAVQMAAVALAIVELLDRDKWWWGRQDGSPNPRFVSAAGPLGREGGR
jgi:NTP pyrophosphatase (non-canonical NTP hydrolase)